tara:strand:+ start:204 stop:557 length:354 start_codon:yes stop_codon:yes gene_type:complete
MNFIDSVKSCLGKYAVFSGRASRSEYWYFFLFNIIVGAILGFVEGLLNLFPDTNRSVLASIGSLLLFLPYISCSVRRLHDINRVGWWALLSFIPIFGWIILLVFFLQKSHEGPNRFG